MATKHRTAGGSGKAHHSPVAGTTSGIAVGTDVPVTFPSTGEGLYVLHPDADEMVVVDQLTARLSHLSAMLSLTYGEERKGFERMSDKARNDYMSGCAAAVDELTSHRRFGGGAGAAALGVNCHSQGE